MSRPRVVPVPCVGRTADVAGVDGRMQLDKPGVVGVAGFRDALEALVAALAVLLLHGQVVAAHHHIQRGRNQRVAGGRGEHVARAEHGLLGFQHRHGGEGYVHGHLVAVEVGVESRTDQRVNLNGVSVDQHGHEGLDPETVQGGCAV